MDPTQWLTIGVFCVACYLLGSMPTGYLIVKQMTGKDLRTIGSGSTGATNVRRVAGENTAKMVMAIDILKAMVPVLIAKWILFPEIPSIHIAAGVFAIIGHSKSVFLSFKGGKSAACGLGTAFGLNPIIGLLTGLIAFSISKFTRYVSLGSIIGAACLPIFFYLFGSPWVYTIFIFIASSYVIYLHKANIVRLIQGTENRLT